MRLTASTGATVVRDLRWQARRLAGAQDEARNRGLERRSVLAQKAVVTLHPALPRLQYAEALIFVHQPGHYGRLFAYHPFTDHLGVHTIAHGVVNQPATRE